jgi:Fe-S cluster assembly protein SufB
MNKSQIQLKNLINQPYKYGFTTNIKKERIEKGLNIDIVKLINEKKKEPFFMLDFRLKALAKWQKMIEPNWSFLNYKKPNYQNIRYYSAPL